MIAWKLVGGTPQQKKEAVRYLQSEGVRMALGGFFPALVPTPELCRKLEIWGITLKQVALVEPRPERGTQTFFCGSAWMITADEAREYAAELLAEAEEAEKNLIPTFIRRVLKGHAALEDVDDFIDDWHKSEDPRTLLFALGMSRDEYTLFLQSRENLRGIVEAHRPCL